LVITLERHVENIQAELDVIDLFLKDKSKAQYLEIEKIDRLESHKVKSGLSSSIASLYSGIEYIFESIFKEIDGKVFSGQDYHQNLIYFAKKSTPNRSALISHQLYDTLSRLKNFRHLVRKNYSIDIRMEGVVDNAELAKKVGIEFIESIGQFINTLNDDSDNEIEKNGLRI
jgi:thermostable 8-oxoguanine DNA glycosylase